MSTDDQDFRESLSSTEGEQIFLMMGCIPLRARARLFTKGARFRARRGKARVTPARGSNDEEARSQGSIAFGEVHQGRPEKWDHGDDWRRADPDLARQCCDPVRGPGAGC